MAKVQYETFNSTPNAKVVAATLAALFTPMVAAWLGDVSGVAEVEVIESVLLGLVTALVTGITGYMKRPNAGDGVRRVVDLDGDDGSAYHDSPL